MRLHANTDRDRQTWDGILSAGKTAAELDQHIPFLYSFAYCNTGQQDRVTMVSLFTNPIYSADIYSDPKKTVAFSVI